MNSHVFRKVTEIYLRGLMSVAHSQMLQKKADIERMIKQMRQNTNNWVIWVEGIWEFIVLFLQLFWKKVKVAQLCPALCDPMDYTVHGILQARILEWVAFPFSRGSSQPRDRTQVSSTAGRFFTSWATRETRWRLTWKPLCQKNEELKKQSRPRKPGFIPSFLGAGSVFVDSFGISTSNLPLRALTWDLFR